jgi:hypothetical protein
MSAARPGTAILGAVVATVVALWLSYAVAAGLMQAGGGAADTPRAPSEAAPFGLALTPAPELRVRPALLKRAAASAAAATAPRAPAPAPAPAPAAAPAKTEPANTAHSMSTPEPMTHAPSPAATPAPAAPVQPAPVARPAPKPKPTLAAQPKQPAAPDFDEASPSGFDNAG